MLCPEESAVRFDTIAAHAAGPDPATLAVAPPIHLSTTFARNADYALAAPYSYVREGSPTHDLVETAMARLEGGEAALVFSSGMAAGTALLHALPPGSHVVMPEDVYYGYRVAAVDFFERQGVAHTFAPLDDLGALRAALRPETRLVWLETPSNPLLRVTDLRGAIAIAREAGAAVVVTYPSAFRSTASVTSARSDADGIRSSTGAKNPPITSLSAS